MPLTSVNSAVPCAALILVLLVWLAPGQWLLTILLLLPLLSLLPGLWLQRPKAIAIGALVSIFYVVFATMEAFANPQIRSMALLASATAVWLFVSLLLAARAARNQSLDV